jgi:hypothetical protein
MCSLRRISRDGRPTCCRTALTRRQRSVSAKQQPARMGSLRRPIHSTLPIGGSTRPRSSVSRWKDRASNLGPAAANTRRRQRDCGAPCCSPLQTSCCERTSLRSLSWGAFASASAIAHAGKLLHSHLDRHPVCIQCSLREGERGRGRTAEQGRRYAPVRQGCRPKQQPFVLAFHVHESSRGRSRYTLAGVRACRETSAFVAFDPAVVSPHPKIGGGASGR